MIRYIECERLRGDEISITENCRAYLAGVPRRDLPVGRLGQGRTVFRRRRAGSVSTAASTQWIGWGRRSIQAMSQPKIGCIGSKRGSRCGECIWRRPGDTVHHAPDANDSDSGLGFPATSFDDYVRTRKVSARVGHAREYLTIRHVDASKPVQIATSRAVAQPNLCRLAFDGVVADGDAPC